MRMSRSKVLISLITILLLGSVLLPHAYAETTPTDSATAVAAAATAAHASHCVCTGRDPYDCDHSAIEGEWIPWDGKSNITAGGNYYLTQDITTGGDQRWLGYYKDANGFTINLCLNGHSMISPWRVFAVGKNTVVNLMNCSATPSRLQGHCYTGDQGGTLLIQSGSEMNVYGDIRFSLRSDITDRLISYGGFAAVDGTLRMYGATVSGGKVSVVSGKSTSGYGGVFYINGKLELHDTTVIGGEAELLGGAVYMSQNSSISISGSTRITGGKDQNGESNVYLRSGQLINLRGDLTDDAAIGVTMERQCGNFTTKNAYASMQNAFRFTLDNSNGKTAVTEQNSLCFTGYRVGYAVAEINPTPDGSVEGTVMPVGLSGYGNESTRIATSVDSTLGLIASILAVTDEDNQTVLIISCDSASVSDAIRNKIVAHITAELGIPASHIFVNSNHQHSTPTGSSEYNDKMARWVADAAAVALDNRAAATISTASAYVNEGYAQNNKFNYVRNYTLLNSAGQIVGMVTDNHSDIGLVSYSKVANESEADDQVQLVRFKRAGESTVILANFQAHPHLLTSGSSTVVTSDIVGVFRNELEKSLEAGDPGANYEVMYISGAGGNLNAQGRSDAGCWASSTYANKLAHAKLLPQRTYAVIKNESEWSDVEGGQIHTLSYFNAYPVRLNEVPSRWASTVTLAQYEAAAQDAVDNGYTQATHRNKYGIYSIFDAKYIIQREDFTEDTKRNLPIAAFSIGDIAFVAVSYEMFDTNGMEIKDNSPFAMTVVCTLANAGTTTSYGHNGYVPSQLGYTNGGYSTDITRYAPGTGEQVVSDLLDMLDLLQEKADTPYKVQCECADPTSINNPCADAGHQLHRWYPWTDTTTVPHTAGYWYLQSDITLTNVTHNYTSANLSTTTGLVGRDSSGNLLNENVSVCVDLNGHTVTGKVNHRIYRIEDNGTYKHSLTITDSVGTGCINSKSSTNNANYGTIVWMRGIHHTLTVYGGVLDASGSNIASTGLGGAISANGTVNIYGGTVIGCAGSVKGNVLYVPALTKVTIAGNAKLSGSGNYAVYTLGNNRINISGSPVISSVYLASNARLVVGELAGSAKIGVGAAAFGTFTSTASSEYIGNFTPKMSGATIKANNNGSLALVSSSGQGLNTSTHATHCVCGGKDAQCSGHSELTGEWMPWDGTTAITVSGNYYLTKDLTGSTQRWIGTNNGLNGYTVNLCLNGHSIASNFRIFGVATGMTLNVMNCSNTTSVLMGCSADNDFGSVINIQPNATVSMYDNIHLLRDERSDRVVPHSGAISCYGNFYMYGGTVTGGTVTVVNGNTASGRAGAIYAFGGSEIKILDGVIIGGTANLGGCMYVSSGAKVYLADCTIAGGVATTAGGGIYAEASASITLGGNVKIIENTAAGAANDLQLQSPVLSISNSGMSDEASVGIFMDKPGVFCYGGHAGRNAFYSNVSEQSVVSDGKNLTFSSIHLPHCDCAERDDASVCDHKDKDATWIAWDCSTDLTESGKYFLTKDFYKLGRQIIVGDAANGTPMAITLCTNQYDLESTLRTLYVCEGVTLHICNCEPSVHSWIFGSGNANEDGGVIHVQPNATINLHNGVYLARNGSKTVTRGGVVSILGSFNMYGGWIGGYNSHGSTIAACTAQNGGTIYTAGTFNQYGGEITNGQATNGGGNIYIDETGAFNMYGGNLINGKTSGGCGGNILNKGTLHINDGTVSGGINTGTASDNAGGNIMITHTNAQATITGNAVVSGGQAQTRGANIFLLAGNLTVSGSATITSGTLRDTSGAAYAPCILQSELVGTTYEGGIHFEGGPTVTEAYIHGGYITVGSLESGASIGLNRSEPGYLTQTPVPESSLPMLLCNNTDYRLGQDSQGLRVIGARVSVLLNGSMVFLDDVSASLVNTNQYIALHRDITEDISIPGNVYLDLNGYNISGNITISGKGQLMVFDSATSDYTGNNRGKITGTVTGSIAPLVYTPATYGHTYRYVMLQENDGSLSFHRFYLAVRSILLSPCKDEEAGTSTTVNYKTVLKCNDVMAGYVTGYGTVLTGDNSVYVNHLQRNGFTLAGGNTELNLAATALTGTMKTSNSEAVNKENALKAPIVSAYFTLADGTEVTGTTFAISLRDVVASVCSLDSLTDLQLSALKIMYRMFQPVIDTWNIDLSKIK